MDNLTLLTGPALASAALASAAPGWALIVFAVVVALSAVVVAPLRRVGTVPDEDEPDDGQVSVRDALRDAPGAPRRSRC